MGEAGETRSKETGNHVKRVAEYSYAIALACGLSKSEAEILRMANPMRDIGKIAVPDAILKKPDKLDEAEFEIMKAHAETGYQILIKLSQAHLESRRDRSARTSRKIQRQRLSARFMGRPSLAD
jgi:response regulator RpfG family c-di-GMP phosphodiesterase